MKRTFTILMAVAFITTVISGCGRERKATAQTDCLVLSEKIIELADGLSAVRHSGNYGFDEFLAQGGASSDSEVVSFLTDNGIADLKNLLFRGNPC